MYTKTRKILKFRDKKTRFLPILRKFQHKNWFFSKNHLGINQELQSSLVKLRRWTSDMFSMQNIDKNYFNPILNFQQNVQQSSAFLSLIVPDLFSVDSQGQKDRQVQRDRYKDKDVLYHRMHLDPPVEGVRFTNIAVEVAPTGWVPPRWPNSTWTCTDVA